MWSRQQKQMYMRRWQRTNAGKRAAYLKRWRRNNPHRVKLAFQRQYKKLKASRHFTFICYLRHLRATYGPGSVEHYLKTRKKQHGKCAICRKRKKLLFEHCHKTGQHRGLCCRDCNLGLGGFKDEVGLLQRAIAYLKKHKGKRS
jgi:hypothetical protein